MDEEGNLIGVKDTINFDEREVADSDTAKKNQELMEEAISRAADAAVVGSLDEKEKED
jgi:predicted methyltransferase MtxX (methanogen marker protein 4)